MRRSLIGGSTDRHHRTTADTGSERNKQRNQRNRSQQRLDKKRRITTAHVGTRRVGQTQTQKNETSTLKRTVRLPLALVRDHGMVVSVRLWSSESPAWTQTQSQMGLQKTAKAQLSSAGDIYFVDKQPTQQTKPTNARETPTPRQPAPSGSTSTSMQLLRAVTHPHR